MQVFTREEARSRLGALPGWEIEEGLLVKTFKPIKQMRHIIICQIAPSSPTIILRIILDRVLIRCLG